MKIYIPAKIVEIPDGDRCVIWEPGKLMDCCKFYQQETQYTSSVEAIKIGLGMSGGSMTWLSCRLFDVGLTNYRYGYGVRKCKQCVEQKIELGLAAKVIAKLESIRCS